MSDRHAELTKAITQEAKLTYRIEAERFERIGEDKRNVRLRFERILPLTVGLSVLAGALSFLLTGAVIPSLIVGSTVMIISALLTTRTSA